MSTYPVEWGSITVGSMVSVIDPTSRRFHHIGEAVWTSRSGRTHGVRFPDGEVMAFAAHWLRALAPGEVTEVFGR